MLKKILLGTLIAFVLILVFHSFIIGVFVKPQVAAIASKALGTEVKISMLSVRLWPGSAAIYGLKIQNPKGFSNDQLLDLGSASVDLNVAGLIKQFTSSSNDPKIIVIDQVKIKDLKFLFEQIEENSKAVSNVNRLIENMEKQSDGVKGDKEEAPENTADKKGQPEIHVELKSFVFENGEVVIKDSTIGSGFEYEVHDINIQVDNIYSPGKPASELVETIEFSAELGKENPGTIHLKGRSNFMAGPNLDSQLTMKDINLVNFNAFVSDQPFQMTAGFFDLDSKIEMANNNLKSKHQLKLNSLKLGGKEGGNKLIGLPVQTLITAVSRLPSIDVPFEVNGDLTNPKFNITQAIRLAITAGIQRVLASGLGDLKGLATDIKGQTLDVAEKQAVVIKDDAKKIVKGLTGEGSEKIDATIDAGMDKLSGLLAKVKSE